MKCTHEDAFDDMYPEFAPEPIVVPCEEEATFIVRVSSQAFDEMSGRPMIGVREAYDRFLCTEHARLLNEVGLEPYFAQKLLSVRAL